MNTFEDVIGEISHEPLQKCLREFFRTRCGKHSQFSIWPASLSYHHAYPGGLAEHTLEVCRIAWGIYNTGTIRVPQKSVLLASCLWHDFAKIHEYVLLPDSESITGRKLSFHQNLVWCKAPGTPDGEHPHIEQGAANALFEMKKWGVDSQTQEDVEHCILAHHGRREWGSPVEPQSSPALILHAADMLSAKYGYKGVQS